MNSTAALLFPGLAFSVNWSSLALASSGAALNSLTNPYYRDKPSLRGLCLPLVLSGSDPSATVNPTPRWVGPSGGFFDCEWFHRQVCAGGAVQNSEQRIG